MCDVSLLAERESNPTESDMDMYWKQAECLGFKREAQYSYDGVTGQFGFQALVVFIESHSF